MATTISRLSIRNDTGTSASPNGDGTVINAVTFSLLQDNIDALIANAITFGSTLTVEGFGTHSLSAGGTGGNTLIIRNTTAGTTNFSR